jgi:hypothetical protein
MKGQLHIASMEKLDNFTKADFETETIDKFTQLLKFCQDCDLV